MISVIMSTYREPVHYLRTAVESILSQTETALEFIIVADDPHNTEARKLLSAYAQRDPRITLLINRHNCGLATSLNRALHKATGEYIARMDADDVALPTRLAAQQEYLCRTGLDLVGAAVIRIDEHDNSLMPTQTREDSPELVMASLRIAPCVPHPTWFAKRTVYDTLDGYRTMPRCEDYDFLLRAMYHGFRVGMCPLPLLRYRVLPHSISRTALLSQHRASRYLARHFSRIEQITPHEVQCIVARVSERQNARYREAEERLFAALSQSGWRRYAGVLRSLTTYDQVRRCYDIWRMHRLRQGG